MTLIWCVCREKFQSMWFIGLQFNKTEHVNIDLTYDTRSFVDTVKRQATAINIYKQDMEVDIKYVRRRELGKYLPAHVVTQSKKKGIKSHSPGSTPAAGKKPLGTSKSDSALLGLVGSDGMGGSAPDTGLISDDSSSGFTVTSSGVAGPKRKLDPETGADVAAPGDGVADAGGSPQRRQQQQQELNASCGSVASGEDEGPGADGAGKRCRSDEVNSTAFLDAIGLGHNSAHDLPFLERPGGTDGQLQQMDGSPEPSPLDTSSGALKRQCEDSEGGNDSPKRPKPDSTEPMEEDEEEVSSSQHNHVMTSQEPAVDGKSPAASGPESVIALQRNTPRPMVTSSVAVEEKGRISDGIDSTTARSPLETSV